MTHNGCGAMGALVPHTRLVYSGTEERCNVRFDPKATLRRHLEPYGHTPGYWRIREQYWDTVEPAQQLIEDWSILGAVGDIVHLPRGADPGISITNASQLLAELDRRRGLALAAFATPTTPVFPAVQEGPAPAANALPVTEAGNA
jgi:hypothetical protein